MVSGKEKFGAFIRREREGLDPKVGLRAMAKKILVSPTYLSKIERDEFPPPAEDKVIAIAEILDLDVDVLLARAGKVSSDLTQIIREHPREMASVLRGCARGVHRHLGGGLACDPHGAAAQRDDPRNRDDRSG